MDGNIALLLKIPCIISLCFAWQYTFVPPHTAKKDECIPTNSLGYYWIDAGKGWIQHDDFQASFWAVGLAEVASILLGGKHAHYFHLSPSAVFALALVLLGMWMRKKCYAAMSENYTFDLAIRKNHSLTTHGPYGIVRHPGYTAMIVQYSGVLLWFASPGSWIMESNILGYQLVSLYLLVLAVYELGILASLLVWRIPNEDKILRDRFGKEWDDYAKRVPCVLFPGVI